MKILKTKHALEMGFSQDRRKRRSEHRTAAKNLINGGTLFNSKAPPGSIPWVVAQWHLFQARGIR